jgi:hypothetical protein
VLCTTLLGAGSAGCGDDGSQPTSRNDDRERDTDRDDDRDDGFKGEDCRCAPGQVCDLDGDRCIDDFELDLGERYGRVELARTLDAADESLARVDVGFRGFEPLPDDRRHEYYTDEDERCALDMGADDYPSYVAGRLWPTGARLGTGDLTITASDGAGEVRLEEHKPGFFQVSHPDAQSMSFDADYLPLGDTVAIEAAGGEDLAAFTFAGALLPADFEIVAPAAMSEGDEPLSRTEGIRVKWSPGQQTATMEIGIQAGPDQAHLTCLVADDGEALIPAEAVMQFGSKVSLSLRRLTPRYRALETDEGQTVHLYAIGSHLRVVELCIGSCASATPSPFGD